VEDNRAQFDDLSVEFDPESSEYRTYGGELLESVFSNLLSNAAVHNDGPMTVRVSVDETGPSDVVVNVEGRRERYPRRRPGRRLRDGCQGGREHGDRIRIGLRPCAHRILRRGVSVGDSDLGGAAFLVRLRRARERVSQKRCPSGERGSKAVDGLFSPVIPCKKS